MNAAGEMAPHLWRVEADPEAPGRFIGLAQSSSGKLLALHSDNREFLQQHLITMQMQNADDGEGRFLAAWKRGVRVGPWLFHCDAPSIDTATDKEQLRPRWDEVERYLGSRPEPWQRKFVMGMCSFYNSDWMHEWARRLRTPRSSVGNLAITLDLEHREILADLLSSYRGW